MTTAEEVAAFVTSISDAEAQLNLTLVALRKSAKAVNELGSLASTLQRNAQDVEYAALPPELKAFLDGNYIQRTEFVNRRAAEVAEKLRQLSRGVIDLLADGEKASAIAEGE